MTESGEYHGLSARTRGLLIGEVQTVLAAARLRNELLEEFARLLPQLCCAAASEGDAVLANGWGEVDLSRCLAVWTRAAEAENVSAHVTLTVLESLARVMALCDRSDISEGDAHSEGCTDVAARAITRIQCEHSALDRRIAIALLHLSCRLLELSPSKHTTLRVLHEALRHRSPSSRLQVRRLFSLAKRHVSLQSLLDLVTPVFVKDGDFGADIAISVLTPPLATAETQVDDVCCTALAHLHSPHFEVFAKNVRVTRMLMPLVSPLQCAALVDALLQHLDAGDQTKQTTVLETFFEISANLPLFLSLAHTDADYSSASIPFENLVRKLRRLAVPAEPHEDALGQLTRALLQETREQVSEQTRRLANNILINMARCACQLPRVVLQHRQLQHIRARKEALQTAVRAFNLAGHKAFSDMQSLEVLPAPVTSESIADFLYHHSALLDKKRVAQVLMRNEQVLRAFVAHLPLQGLTLDAALRSLVSHCFLRGEAQQIEKVLEAFSEHYFECLGDGEKPFASATAVLVVSYAVVMLNTDAWTATVKNKMTKEQFRANLRGTNTPKDAGKNEAGEFDPHVLDALYESVTQRQIRISDHGVSEVADLRDWWRTLSSGRSGSDSESLVYLVVSHVLVDTLSHLLVHIKNPSDKKAAVWTALSLSARARMRRHWTHLAQFLLDTNQTEVFLSAVEYLVHKASDVAAEAVTASMWHACLSQLMPLPADAAYLDTVPPIDTCFHGQLHNFGDHSIVLPVGSEDGTPNGKDGVNIVDDNDTDKSTSGGRGGLLVSLLSYLSTTPVFNDKPAEEAEADEVATETALVATDSDSDDGEMTRRIVQLLRDMRLFHGINTPLHEALSAMALSDCSVTDGVATDRGDQCTAIWLLMRDHIDLCGHGSSSGDGSSSSEWLRVLHSLSRVTYAGTTEVQARAIQSVAYVVDTLLASDEDSDDAAVVARADRLMLLLKLLASFDVRHLSLLAPRICPTIERVLDPKVLPLPRHAAAACHVLRRCLAVPETDTIDDNVQHRQRSSHRRIWGICRSRSVVVATVASLLPDRVSVESLCALLQVLQEAGSVSTLRQILELLPELPRRYKEIPLLPTSLEEDIRRDDPVLEARLWLSVVQAIVNADAPDMVPTLQEALMTAPVSVDMQSVAAWRMCFTDILLSRARALASADKETCKSLLAIVLKTISARAHVLVNAPRFSSLLLSVLTKATRIMSLCLGDEEEGALEFVQTVKNLLLVVSSMGMFERDASLYQSALKTAQHEATGALTRFIPEAALSDIQLSLRSENKA
ncbi:MAG: hypothetical protein MHM6MM_003705 [Cercozoa sp. M6MM]